MGSINLENINDVQKNLLTQISYLNINDDGRRKILNGGISVAELYNYLDTPDAVFVGDNHLPQDITKKVIDTVIGEECFLTHKQLLDILVNNGLGDLVVINISEKQNILSNGFQALTFVDSYGSRGFSYRGSDFGLFQGAVRDWVEADILEYFTGTSSQIKEALAYFNENKNSEGKNFLYGYSLGGNLVSHNYLNNHNEIREAFIINGNPLNQKLLDTQEKIAAFNDPEKYHCNIIGGDIIGHLKSSQLYKNNVRYIKNNDLLANSPVASHMVLSSTYDEYGNFVYIDEQEMIKEMGSGYRVLVSICQNIRELLNKMESTISKPEYKRLFEIYRNSTLKHFDYLYRRFGSFNVGNIKDSSQLMEMFQSIDADKQQVFIDTILEYMENNLNDNSDMEESKVMR